MKREFRTLCIEEFATVSSGSTPLRSRHKDYFENGTIPWVKTMDLNNGKIEKTDECITDLAARNCKSYRAGTVLVAMYGGYNQIGRTGLLVRDSAVNQAISTISVDESLVTPEYLLQYLNHNVDKWKRFAASSRKDPNITSNDVRDFQVEVPPLPEQKAIANTLSTWDTAIETMERLIAAKVSAFRYLRADAIHQAGVMHKALSPLSQAFQSLTRKNTVGEINVLTTSAQRGLVSQQTYFSKSVASDNLEGYFLVERGDFAYNRSSSNGYPYGAIKRLDDSERGVLSTLNICMSLREPQQHNSDYFVHVFEAGYLNRGFSQICQEGARSHGLLNVSREDFFGLEIPIPDKASQDQIAAKLNLVQSELAIHRKQLELLRRQKRGLMQKLLTGAWRVNLSKHVERA